MEDHCQQKEYEIEMMKLRQSSVEVAADLSSAQIKINDMKAKINHVRGLNENYRILLANCHTLGNRCHKERLKTFSAAVRRLTFEAYSLLSNSGPKSHLACVTNG